MRGADVGEQFSLVDKGSERSFESVFAAGQAALQETFPRPVRPTLQSFLSEYNLLEDEMCCGAHAFPTLAPHTNRPRFFPRALPPHKTRTPLLDSSRSSHASLTGVHYVLPCVRVLLVAPRHRHGQPLRLHRPQARIQFLRVPVFCQAGAKCAQGKRSAGLGAFVEREAMGASTQMAAVRVGWLRTTTHATLSALLLPTSQPRRLNLARSEVQYLPSRSHSPKSPTATAGPPARPPAIPNTHI